MATFGRNRGTDAGTRWTQTEPPKRAPRRPTGSDRHVTQQERLHPPQPLTSRRVR